MATPVRKSIRAGEVLTRIAVVDSKKCKPKKCKLECKTFCPVVSMGKLCIEVSASSKISYISEELCIGCNICVNKCPFEAISMFNLPKNIEHECVYRYGSNSFKLHRLPIPRAGQVLGLLGSNGVGKTTCLSILAGKIQMNFGKFDEEPPSWKDVIKYYRGSPLQNYFQGLSENKIKCVIKPQFVDAVTKIPEIASMTVIDVIKSRDERKIANKLIEELEMTDILNRQIKDLSGGELQKFVCVCTMIKDGGIYIFDEPTTYLDVSQRIKMGRAIRNVCSDDRVDKYVIVVDHDLCLLDYMCDTICLLYGKPRIYGVVTAPAPVGDAINHFLSGFIPSENLRFRPFELSFKVKDTEDDTNDIDTKESKSESKDEKDIVDVKKIKYPKMEKILKSALKDIQGIQSSFKLTIEPGFFVQSEIIVLLSANGSGKTTMVNMLAGLVKPDKINDIESADTNANADVDAMPSFSVSVKPQKLFAKFEGTVQEFFHEKIKSFYTHPQFVTDVIKPLQVDQLFDHKVKTLSGGELSKTALVLCLGKPADLYLIDEPGSFVDAVDRLTMGKVIKRFIKSCQKTAFVIEHDILLSQYLADRVIVFSGTPAKECVAHSPQSLLSGMNSFLKSMDITFRRDNESHRPRINKHGSVKHEEQRKMGTYLYLDKEKEPTVP